MELKMIQGCTEDSLTVDGFEEINMTDNQRIEIMNHIFDFLKLHPESLNYLMQTVVPEYGTVAISSKPCECCGSNIYTYTLNID